jgi:hypothetical protein
MIGTLFQESESLDAKRKSKPNGSVYSFLPGIGDTTAAGTAPL